MKITLFLYSIYVVSNIYIFDIENKYGKIKFAKNNFSKLDCK